MLAILISCGKDGSIGPQGEQGIQGIRGEKGEDGSTIYSGSVVPQADFGNVGDFYFRTSTSDFYGPKTASGWGTPINLRGAAGATGATGATGAAGSKILSGTAVPTASTGVNGDFYLRTTTADFYGPKTFSGWGTPINLRGPQGPVGPDDTVRVTLPYREQSKPLPKSRYFVNVNVVWRVVFGRFHPCGRWFGDVLGKQR